MIVTASMPMVKRCPYVEEVDAGTVTFVWHDRDAPDLHLVAANVAAYVDVRATHEAVTAELASLWDAEVTTTWQTGPFAVTVVAQPS